MTTHNPATQATPATVSDFQQLRDIVERSLDVVAEHRELDVVVSRADLRRLLAERDAARAELAQHAALVAAAREWAAAEAEYQANLSAIMTAWTGYDPLTNPEHRALRDREGPVNRRRYAAGKALFAAADKAARSGDRPDEWDLPA